MEDQAGNTHLFYRLYYYSSNNGNIVTENSIYHLDILNGIDSLFLEDDGHSYTFGDNEFHTITDYEFWNNDPSKFIYCGENTSVDPVAFIQRFDQSTPSFNYLGFAGKVEISKQNDSLIFAWSPLIMQSNDGGVSWNTDSLFLGKELVSLSPFNDSILFVQDYSGLYKTTNRGKNFSIIDTFQTDYKQFLYDKDKNHIYRVTNSWGENFLLVSDDKGNPGTWAKTFSDSNKLYITLDDSVSGSIYLADRNYIYHSNDYGNNFSLIKKLDHDIVGIYKKPNSNKLYVATKYKLLEINGDSVKTLKSLPIDPKIFSYYPLEIGDRWIYNYVNHDCSDFSSPCQVDSSIVTRKVIGDTLMNNGNKYYILKDSYFGTSYERIDSVTGKIFRYRPDSTIADSEDVIDDLLAEVGDTIATNYGGRFDNARYSVFQKQEQITLFDSTYASRSYHSGALLVHTYSLTKGFGFSRDLYEFDFGYATESLKGAVINGKVYGDTMLTDIKKTENSPSDFSLSQNYPNPFNPTTTIHYSIPTGQNVSTVQLKVCDVLGKIVATLVNKEQRPGSYEVQFNASNLASGIYFYRLTYGNLNLVRKMILLK